MKQKYLSLIACAAMLLAGCAKEQVLTPEGYDADLIPIGIRGAINQQATKANAEGFVDKDAVGLFAVNYLEDNTVAGTLVSEGNQADNVKYIFDEANFKWNPVRAVYYKDINTHADLYLYYPYQASITDVNAAGFEVKKDQSAAATVSELSGYEASDFLWGKGEDITPSQSAVSITLSHKLAAVQVALAEGTGFEDGEFESLEKSVILTGTTRKATIDYATGIVTAVGNPQLDGIVMCPQNDGNWRAIAIPQTVAANTQLFAITVNGVSYKFSQASAVTYQSGKQTDFTITVNRKSPSGEYEFALTDVQITDWTEDKNTHGGEARQYFVVNVTEPGTLGVTIKAMGKNPDKIRNLKVVGNVRDDDFYFMRDSMAILEAVNMKESVIKAPKNQSTIVSVATNSEDYKYLCQALGEPDNENVLWYSTAYWYDKGHNIPKDAFKDKRSLCYFCFPESVNIIGEGAFYKTDLSGALILPDGMKAIMNNVFYETNIGSVTFPSNLTYIGSSAFQSCKMTGYLTLPTSLMYIGNFTFNQIKGLSGNLHLPDNLEYLGCEAFCEAGKFEGDLIIPDKITHIGEFTFFNTSFNGRLILNNVSTLESRSFTECGFQGELVIPEGITEIPSFAFCYNNFSSVIFPNSIRTIGDYAFGYNKLTGRIAFPEGFVATGQSSFVNNQGIQEIGC